jgi:hypothetical protein
VVASIACRETTCCKTTTAPAGYGVYDTVEDRTIDGT